MSKRKWNSGPPPFPHWWQVVVDKYKDEHDANKRWGWWNGTRWSIFCDASFDKHQAAGYAACPGGIVGTDHILWNRSWPANARVPRINPNKKG